MKRTIIPGSATLNGIPLDVIKITYDEPASAPEIVDILNRERETILSGRGGYLAQEPLRLEITNLLFGKGSLALIGYKIEPHPLRPVYPRASAVKDSITLSV